MSKQGRKNKRGDRGSLEEEEGSLAKRSNMEEEDDEPSLYEIKTMLKNIQESVASILQENLKIKGDIANLKPTIRSNERELKALKSIVDKTNKAHDTLVTELDSTRRKLKEQIEETVRLDEELEKLEQYTRKNSLEILGVPENAYGSTEEVVIKLGQALNVPINSEDIEISHHLKRKKSRPIIVKFVSHKTKARLYKERTKLKNVNLTDVFPLSHAGAAQTDQRIFINENLTAYRRMLMGKANALKKDGGIVSVWSIDGKIFIKTSPDGTPRRIYCEDDLNNL